MAAWGGGGNLSRGGLSARPGPPDQLQVSIDSGEQFDLDREIDGLRSQVGRLKEVSTAIHDETQLQTRLMEQLEATMESGKLMLRKSVRRLKKAYTQSQSNHLLYLLLFVLGVFFLLYAWAKVYRWLKWVF